jgi:hypothetical protein
LQKKKFSSQDCDFTWLLTADNIGNLVWSWQHILGDIGNQDEHFSTKVFIYSTFVACEVLFSE